MAGPNAAKRATDTQVRQLASSVNREVLNAGRGVVQASSTRWRRVTDGSPCGFCAMLASRGPVYTSSSAAGDGGNRYHTHCGCSVEPFEGDPWSWVPTAEEQRYIDAYHESYYTGISEDELVARIEARLAELTGTADSMTGTVLMWTKKDGTPGRSAPLKGRDGHSLDINEYNNTPYARADNDFRYIADPDDRATAVLQYVKETEEMAKTAARNISTGKPPLDGVDVTRDTAQLLQDGYTKADLEQDVTLAARRLLQWSDESESLGVVYRGIQKPGMSIDAAIDDLHLDNWWHASTTPDKNLAAGYSGRPDRTTSLVLEIHGAKGVKLDSVGDHAIKREYLATGDFRITKRWTEVDADGWQRTFLRVEAQA